MNDAAPTFFGEIAERIAATALVRSVSAFLAVGREGIRWKALRRLARNWHMRMALDVPALEHAITRMNRRLGEFGPFGRRAEDASAKAGKLGEQSKPPDFTALVENRGLEAHECGTRLDVLAGQAGSLESRFGKITAP